MTPAGGSPGRDAGERAVNGVVGTLLALSVVTSFVVSVHLTWVPVWVNNHETEHAAEVGAAMAGWADEAEAHIARSLVNRTFGAGLPVGTVGLPVLATGASSGSVAVLEGPTFRVLGANGTVLLAASGAVEARTGTLRFPPQAFRYAVGAMELRQGHGTWVDLRSLLAAELVGGGRVGLAVQAAHLGGGPQDVGGARDIGLAGRVEEVDSAAWPGGTVRVVAEGVAADAWRAALARQFDAARLRGGPSADCAAAAADWCVDSDDNDADTLDLTLKGVADGWSTRLGRVAVAIRT